MIQTKNQINLECSSENIYIASRQNNRDENLQTTRPIQTGVDRPIKHTTLESQRQDQLDKQLSKSEKCSPQISLDEGRKRDLQLKGVKEIVSAVTLSTTATGRR